MIIITAITIVPEKLYQSAMLVGLSRRPKRRNKIAKIAPEDAAKIP